jgi:hypothetical protein
VARFVPVIQDFADAVEKAPSARSSPGMAVNANEKSPKQGGPRNHYSRLFATSLHSTWVEVCRACGTTLALDSA